MATATEKAAEIMETLTRVSQLEADYQELYGLLATADPEGLQGVWGAFGNREHTPDASKSLEEALHQRVTYAASRARAPAWAVISFLNGKCRVQGDPDLLAVGDFKGRVRY